MDINQRKMIKDKIDRLTRMKAENPEEFTRIIKENIEKNKAFSRRMDAVVHENHMTDCWQTDLDEKPMETKDK